MVMFSDLYLDYQSRSQGAALLWPIWVWRLHVPERPRKGLNALAHTILALHAAGQDDPAWIGSWLGIDTDLVRYIVAAQLTPNGWLDQRSRMTEKGSEQLQGDAEPSTRQRAGLLFQSAESGDLWPRFHSSLQEIEPVDPNAPFPSFIQDRESGRTIKPFLLRPASVSRPSQPSITQIRDALRQDRIARHQRRQRSTDAPEWDDTSAGAVDFIDAEPRAALVLCRVYRTTTSDLPWFVSDPLGQTPAADWMRKEVYQASRRVPALAKILQEFLGETDESMNWEAYRRREDEAVRFEVLTDFPRASSIPDLEDVLVALLRSRSTVAAAGRRVRWEEIGNVTIQGQKVLEHCCLWCLKRWPLANPEHRLPKYLKPDGLRKALGLAAPELSAKVIGQFNVQPGKVFGALKFGTGSFRQYLAAVLLSLADHPHHPFRPLAADETLMLRLLHLSHDRDAEGHGGGSSAERTGGGQALLHAETTLDVVRRLTEGH